MRVKKTLNSGKILELEYTSFKNSFDLIKTIALIVKQDIPDFEIDSNFSTSRQCFFRAGCKIPTGIRNIHFISSRSST